MKYLILFSILFFTLLSCGPKVIFDQKVPIASPWLYDNNIKFDFEVTDETKKYDLILILSHSDVFSFENLYINATTVFPDGTKTTNPVSLQLANEKGEWLGDCSGNNCKISVEMSSDAYFKTRGKYSIVLDQFSRKDSLDGISAIEFKVVESELE